MLVAAAEQHEQEAHAPNVDFSTNAPGPPAGATTSLPPSPPVEEPPTQPGQVAAESANVMANVATFADMIDDASLAAMPMPDAQPAPSPTHADLVALVAQLRAQVLSKDEQVASLEAKVTKHEEIARGYRAQLQDKQATIDAFNKRLKTAACELRDVKKEKAVLASQLHNKNVTEEEREAAAERAWAAWLQNGGNLTADVDISLRIPHISDGALFRAEMEAVKGRGARWKPGPKVWVVPAHTHLRAFAKWL